LRPASQIGYQFRYSLGLVFRPAIFEYYVAPFDVTHFAEAFMERAQTGRGVITRCCAEKSDDRRRPLLRACRERPRCDCAADKREELAAPDAGHLPTRHNRSF
jgi:hypothetical protein